MTRTIKKRIISTSMLVAPAILMLAPFNPAFADCSVTSGSGTVSAPVNGDVISCVVAGGAHSTTIGDGTDVAISVVFVGDAALNKAGGNGIFASNVNLFMGANSSFSGPNTGIFASQAAVPTSVTLFMEGHAAIMSGPTFAFNSSALDNVTTNVTMNDDSSITNGATIFFSSTANGIAHTTLTMNDRASIANNIGAVFNSSAVSQSLVDITMNDDAFIYSLSSAVYNTTSSGGAVSAVTLNGNSYIEAENNTIMTKSFDSADVEAIITLNDNASIRSNDENAIHTITDTGNASSTVSMRGTSSIMAADYGISTVSESGNAEANITLNDDAEITADYGIDTRSNGTGTTVNVNVVLNGDSVITSTTRGINSMNQQGTTSSFITLNGNASVSGPSAIFNSSLGDASLDLVMNGNSSLSGAGVLFNSSISSAVTRMTLHDTAHLNFTGSGVFNSAITHSKVELIMNGQSSIAGSGTNAFYISAVNYAGIDIDMRGSSSISAAGTAVEVGTQASVSMEAGTSITSTGGSALRVSSAGGLASTITSAGLLKGGTKSILLSNGDDTLTLRAGSNLESPTGADMGAGNDTVILQGSGAENEIFLNVEKLVMNGMNWSFTGNSTFDDIDIDAGRFAANGTITVNNNVEIAADGILGGAGTIIGDIVNDGVTAPGNSIGTLSVTGNFVQNAGGVLEMELDGTANDTDLLDITGNAALDGAVRFKTSGNFTNGQTFTFLQAGGGVSGTLTNAGDDRALIDFSLTHNANDVTASAILNPVVTGGRTRGETNVAQAIDAAVANAVAGDIKNIIYGLETFDEVSDFLASHSGLVAASAGITAQTNLGQAAHIVQTRFNAHHNSTQPSMEPQGSPANVEPAAGGVEAKKKQFWAQAIGSEGNIDGDTSARGLDYTMYGIVGGLDTEFDEVDGKIGLFGAYTRTDTDIENLGDTATVNAFQAGLYAMKRIENRWQLNGLISGAWFSFDTSRPTASGEAEADFSGVGGFAMTEILYDINPDDHLVFSPYAGIEGGIVHQGSFSESGAGPLNLDVGSQTQSQISSNIGLQVSGTIRPNMQDKTAAPVIIQPLVRVGWAHQYADTSPSINASFASAPAIAYRSEGPDRSRDAARLSLDLSMLPVSREDTLLYTRYDGSVSSDAQEHRVTAGFKVNW